MTEAYMAGVVAEGAGDYLAAKEAYRVAGAYWDAVRMDGKLAG
jgi:hypothetical protein